MKKIFALAFLISFALQAQKHEKACDIFYKVNDVLQKRHFKPKPVDDSLSVYVFETIMDELDENRSLFLQQEYDQLAIHKYKIDDYLLKKDCSFLNDFISAYQIALERNKTFVQEIAQEPQHYYTKDTIYYSKKTFPYHTDAQKIKKYLRKKITYDILEDIAKLSKNDKALKPYLESLGIISRNKILESYLCRINRQLNPPEGFDSGIYNRFFSTFCSYFDPHSTYFNYNEKASFVSSISTENYSLGLYVSQNEKEEIIVEELVPGGPAYETEKIDKGDQLIKLAANNLEYAVTCTSLEAITDIVNSDTYKEVFLTLRKKDGTVYSVNLIKKIMKADDNSVYSFVLGDNNPIGYIKIPSFYSAFDSTTKQGCADDLAKEVIKLKKDNITGLILDLQFNGGGSMDEVIRMAGMFINFGPIAIVTDQKMSYNVIKDYNRGMLYEGPMVVLVNGFSASASEFFAGVMQDYNRALIVGNTTLGKATMQTILPLEEDSPEDFVKVTIDKFYRVTGKSSQYIGIIPDVELPSFFNDLLPRESSMPTAIKNDSLNVNLTFTKLPDTKTKKAIALSKDRVSKNLDFLLISSVNDRINDIYNGPKAPLPIYFDTVFTDVHSMDDLWKNISDATEKEQQFKIRETTFAAEMQREDSYLKKANSYKMKAAKTDAYINEAINILRDVNSFKNN
ncbi:S41 family peptidase [Flavobacterium cerinum]|uniref:Peptidase S41 n=1 Tax=Flavobacterium cerinum TaxID=2502784 RepID=A0A3S3U3S0_9FLAO|nr:S41 family peptidase [Flavobacterium cerinum]RWX01505.1 peptidase S41 [Flavobacterium cerinum]